MLELLWLQYYWEIHKNPCCISCDALQGVHSEGSTTVLQCQQMQVPDTGNVDLNYRSEWEVLSMTINVKR
jgi:hypothetical protein